MDVRWRRASLLAFALAGCVSSGLRHVDDGDAALSRGRLEEAERAYERALAGDPDLDEPERDSWVVAKVEKGRADIARARIVNNRPWLNLAGTPDKLLAELHETRNKLRALGGDEAAEAAIVEAMNGITTVALRAFAESKQPAWTTLRSARALVVFPELAPATLAPMADLQSAARTVHASAASSATGPLTRRVHTAVGAWIDEAPLADARALAAPFARGIAVTLTGPAAAGCAALAGLASLPPPGAERTLEVTVEVARCEARTQVSNTERSVTWTEQVLERVITTPIYETRCERTYTEVRQCFGNPITCYAGTLVPTGASCSKVQVGVSSTPVYRPEPRTGQRPVEIQTGEYIVELAWTANLGGQTWRGDVRRQDAARGTRGGAYAVFQPFTENWTDPATTFSSASTELVRELRELFDAQVAGERSAARARAEQLASDPNAADEAWVIVALLGADVAGRWQGWGLNGDDLRRAFDAATGAKQSLLGIDATRTFTLPERPRVTAGQLKALESRLVPTLGATLWIDVDAGISSVPAVAAPMGDQMLAGTSAFMLGVRFGHRGLSSMRRATQGVGFVDDIAGEAAAGILYDQPEGAIGSSQLGFAGTYTAAVGFRRIGAVGLFAGLRAEASWAKFGTNSGTHVGITPVGRLELWLGRATIVLDAMAYTLAGGNREALAIHLGRIRQDGPGAKLTRFLSLRLERKTLDVTSQLPYEVDGDLSAEHDVGDLEGTSVTFAYGFGF
jgi:hypothetical protein